MCVFINWHTFSGSVKPLISLLKASVLLGKSPITCFLVLLGLLPRKGGGFHRHSQSLNEAKQAIVISDVFSKKSANTISQK